MSPARIRVTAHYGVEELSLLSAADAARRCLQGLDTADHAIASVSVASRDPGRLMIELDLASCDAESANRRVDAAAEAVKDKLLSHFAPGTLRERQLEVTVY